MAYTNSPLVSYTGLSPNHSGQRTRKKTVDTYHVFYCPMFAEGVGTDDD